MKKPRLELKKFLQQQETQYKFKVKIAIKDSKQRLD